MALLQYAGIESYFGNLITAADPGQAFANLRQRNQFSTLTSIGLLAVLCRISLSSQKCASFRWVLPLTLLALANAASGSRTGFLQWLSISLAMFMWPYARYDLRLGYALLALGIYFLACFLLPLVLQIGTGVPSLGLFDRLAGNADHCQSRLTLWSNVLHLIAQKPWLGWGWGELDYAHFITLYPGERFCDILDNAHNLPLHLAVELGILVAAVFCGVCAWLIWRNKPWSETDPTRQLAWGVLAVIGLHSLLEYPLWYGPFQLAVVLCIWLLWRKPQTIATPAHGPLSARVATGALAVVMLVVCAYTAWDYWRISQIYLAPEARNAAYRDDTLAKIRDSRLFRNQVLFAELTTTDISPENAGHLNSLAKDMLHFSPEPRVVEKVIESAVLLGRDNEALFYLQRYKAAFPEQHARWSATLRVPLQD